MAHAVVLALMLTMEAVPVAPACPADADLSGLMASVAELGEVGRDAASVIEGYRQERELLCERIEAAATREALYRRRIELLQDVARLERENADDFRSAFEHAPAPHRPWFACGVGVFSGVGVDKDATLGLGGACIVTVWPR